MQGLRIQKHDNKLDGINSYFGGFVNIIAMQYLH